MQVIGYDLDANDEDKQARTIGLDWDMTCLGEGGVENRRGCRRLLYEMCKCSGCNRSLIHVSLQFLTFLPGNKFVCSIIVCSIIAPSLHVVFRRA